MKRMRVVAMMAAVMIFGACTGHESVTAPYDDEVVSGQTANAAAAATASTATKTSRRRSAGRGTGEAFQFEGVVRSAAADSLVVFTSKKEEVTIALTAQTVIRKGNTTLTVSDLLAGARVHVKALQSATGYTALEVKLQEGEDGGGEDEPAAVREYEGTVRNASATQLVIITSKKEEVTFTITAATDIRKGNTPVLPADLLAGWTVHVKADATNTALLVIVQSQRGEDVELSGTVASVAATSFVVTTATGDVTVQVVSSTQIRRGGKKISLSDVTVGSTVAVDGRRVGATSVEAKKVTVEG